MNGTESIASGLRALRSLGPTVGRLEEAGAARADARRAARRGHFAPDEEDRVRAWFARYLTARAGLLETIADLDPLAPRRGGGAADEVELRRFVVAWMAACLLVRGARFLVRDFAIDRVVQRKLNEAAPSLRIPRRQFTAVYRSLTRPRNAWRLAEALRIADQRREAITALASDPVLAPIVRALPEAEQAVRVDVHRYARARVRYRWHAWRRRRASAAQQASFLVLQAFGRVIADVRNPRHRDRVTSDHRRALLPLLRPGDVLVVRHDHALSNLFLPGYWPHVALHVGDAASRRTLGIEIDPARAARWVDPLCVLEARKDGVRFRALEDALAVDAFTVLRPRLAAAEIARAITGAVAHEGKLYNFDFDFFTDDRLVCTEVVYRAYEGIGGISFPLSRRAGRPTLSAEDIVGLALAGRSFEPVAIFGTPRVGRRLLTGRDALPALAAERAAAPPA